MKKYVVVTGVSTGIGFATTKELITRGFHVFGSVRKDTDGIRVKAELGEEFTPLLFDVTDSEALSKAVEQVQNTVGTQGLAGLVNNAGVAPSGPIMHASLDDVRQTFDINVFGLLAVTQAFLPLLGARLDSPHPPGRIVNISSISGGMVFPLLATYAMSKHAVEALSDGLRRELFMYGIHVSAVEPGTIKTAIWDKGVLQETDNNHNETDYAGVVANMSELFAKEIKNAKSSKVVTDAICHALQSSRPKARYPLTGMWYAAKLIPNWLLDKLMIKVAGLQNKMGR